jgi:integrase
MSKAVRNSLPAFLPVTIPPADVILSPAQPIRQKRKRYMSKRFQAGYVYPVGKAWYGRYRRDVPDQEKREYPSVVLGERKAMTKRAARQKLMDIIQGEGLNKENYLEVLGTPVKTFNDVADAWESKRLPQLKISTQSSAPQQIAKHLRPFFGHLTLEMIKTGTVNDWIGSLQRIDLEPKTVHNQWKQFRAIMNWHFQQNDEPPRKWYPKLPDIVQDEQRWFTPDEVRRIVAAAKGQYKVLFHLAGFSGLRFGELAGLHVECIDFTNGVILVKRSVWRGVEVSTKTKNGYRKVDVNSATVEMLKKHLGGRTTGRVFQTRNGTPLENHNVVRQVLQPICKRLGIAPGGCHAFRHGRVSLMRMENVPGDLIKEQIGHSDLRTTSGYTHFSKEFVRDTVERLAGSCTQNADVHTNTVAASST